MRGFGARFIIVGLVVLSLLLVSGVRSAVPTLATPANDNFTDAIAITTPTVSGVVATGDNTGAGTEAGEPTQPACATGTPTTAPRSGTPGSAQDRREPWLWTPTPATSTPSLPSIPAARSTTSPSPAAT